MEDYEPETDTKRFPREDIHFPEKEKNEYGAWAWKVRIQDQYPREGRGLLEGKTVALKDNIAVKDVPMLLGTAFFQGYVPVCTQFWLLRENHRLTSSRQPIPLL